MKIVPLVHGAIARLQVKSLPSLLMILDQEKILLVNTVKIIKGDEI